VKALIVDYALKGNSVQIRDSPRYCKFFMVLLHPLFQHSEWEGIKPIIWSTKQVRKPAKTVIKLKTLGEGSCL